MRLFCSEATDGWTDWPTSSFLGPAASTGQNSSCGVNVVWQLSQWNGGSIGLLGLLLIIICTCRWELTSGMIRIIRSLDVTGHRPHGSLHQGGKERTETLHHGINQHRDQKITEERQFLHFMLLSVVCLFLFSPLLYYFTFGRNFSAIKLFFSQTHSTHYLTRVVAFHDFKYGVVCSNDCFIISA